ncbi:NSR1 [Symbiodinium sp. CCMP2456]|nr:NSR1 [Symbiodinium sp. CCMP2456]
MYWSVQESMIISMKLLLIVVVQLTFFDNMLMTLRCFVFAINPTSWTDVKRIDPDDPRRGPFPRRKKADREAVH